MNTYDEMLSRIENGSYAYHFWNAMRGREGLDSLEQGKLSVTGTYAMSPSGNAKYMEALQTESLFRRIGTVIPAYGSGHTIFAKDCKDMATWVPEGGRIPLSDGMNDFTTNTVGSHKLAVFIKSDEDFVQDIHFDFEGYLTKRLAKNFARAEDSAFVNGTGQEMPTGILCPGKGAEVAVTTEAITYDDVINLFFSVKPEYRRNGLWLMNDETALHLRTLKDADGNYLWNQGNDTILGKRVEICEYMPGMEAGAMPIVFGDFSYYWIIDRFPISVRPIREEFVQLDQIGHLAYEFLDGKLVRREAVQALAVSDTVETN